LVKTLSREIRECIIKNFMGVLILSRLYSTPMGGYDVIKHIFEKYNVLFSSGTVYSCLQAMERNGLVEGVWVQRKRIYKISDKGRALLNEFRNDKEKLSNCLLDILK
jgi:DNA-binding PadR family transcriptional regulator